MILKELRCKESELQRELRNVQYEINKEIKRNHNLFVNCYVHIQKDDHDFTIGKVIKINEENYVIRGYGYNECAGEIWINFSNNESCYFSVPCIHKVISKEEFQEIYEDKILPYIKKVQTIHD